MIDSALEILYVYVYIINQQAIGYAADVVYMYVCAPFSYVGGWVR